MAVNIGNASQAGLLSQQYPPPLLPKPGKENVRLQKLLKKTAKKKAAAQASQPSVPFRSSLSPVNEASPDLEHSDHSTPPKTPETPFYIGTVHPRFNVRPLYQHVSSPYPHHKGFSYGKTTIFSPPQHMAPGHHLSPTYTASPGLDTHLTPPITILQTSQRVEVSSALTTHVITSKTPSPQLTVLTVSRTAKPLFEVPNITNYTAKSVGLLTPYTSPTRSKTPTAELLRVPTPTFEVRRIVTPTSEIRDRTPTREIRRVTTPTFEVKRIATPTSEIKKTPTPTSEMKTIPSSEMKIVSTSASDIKQNGTLTVEAKQGTTSVETKGVATPIRVKTPTMISIRTPMGRPKTPSDHVSRIRVSVIEISRPNPLLFAVSPVHMEGRRSKTPTLSPLDESHKVSTQVNDTSCPVVYQNGDIDTRSAEPLKEKLEPSKTQEQPKPETLPTPNLETAQTNISLAGYQRPVSVPPFAGQRPKTPTTPKFKPTYYGLTPAEYAAHGGIKSYSPSFSISTTVLPSAEATPLPKQEPVVPQPDETVTTPNEKSEQVVKDETPVVPPPISKAASEPKGDIPAPPVPELKVKIPSVKIPTIVVSAADTPSSEAKAVAISSVTPRVRTPTYGSPRLSQMTPAPPTVKETTKAESKAVPPSDQDVDKPVLSKVSKKPEKPTEAKMSLLDRIKKQNLASSEKVEVKDVVKPKAEPKDQKDLETKHTEPEKETKASPQQEIKPAVEKKEKEDEGSSLPAESLLKAMQKPKGMKSKLSGWSRLKKHMVVEVEEPKFPEVEPGAEKDVSASTDQNESKTRNRPEDETTLSESQDSKDFPRATKMWDAVLFQMFSTEENIMQQIEANKTEEQKRMEAEQKTPKEIPTFAHRLPVLLYSPRFDARRLREAASRPATKIATVFEMGLIGRKNKDEEPKDFNRTAKGFIV